MDPLGKRCCLLKTPPSRRQIRATVPPDIGEVAFHSRFSLEFLYQVPRTRNHETHGVGSDRWSELDGCSSRKKKKTYSQTHNVWLVYVNLENLGSLGGTPWKTNISPENQWLADVVPIEIVPFKGTC